MAADYIDNPFRHNYLFKKSDISRVKINYWKYPLLWLLPTYVQLSDGYEFYFKIFNSMYYLIDVKVFYE